MSDYATPREKSSSSSEFPGRDITDCDSSHDTPSTASFLTVPDPAPDEGAVAPPTPLVFRDMERLVWPLSGGRSSCDDISPVLLAKEPHPPQASAVESEEQWREEVGAQGRRGRGRGAHTLPTGLPFPPGQLLKALREAPLPASRPLGGGGPRGLWRTVLPATRMKKKKKRGRTLPPGEDWMKHSANQRRAAGDAHGEFTTVRS